MSKILKNTTASSIVIADVGSVTILASPGTYTIPPADYSLWAASDDVIAYIGTGDLVVNDGSSDLGPSDGMDVIKQFYTRVYSTTAGPGVPSGGTTGQVLKKNSNVSYDTTWSSDLDTGITELTGDVTAGPGSGSQAATLANSGVTPGSYTTANITVDAKGRVTAASSGTASSDDLVSYTQFGGL